MAAFEIFPIERFAGKSAAIKRPREIAHFSYDEDHQFRLDDSSLRYYYPPRLGADLSAGFESFHKLDDSGDEHLVGLLRTISAMEGREERKCEADVVTWRGMMTKIMVMPYDGQSFEMNATCYQGTIFIEEHHAFKTASRAAETQRRRPHHGGFSPDQMSYWGYKFETLSLLPDTWDAVSRDYIEGREAQVVSNYAQYCSVVRTGMGDASIVLGGEVDAVWDRKPDDPSQPIDWVELKTAADPGASASPAAFERKLLKFWAQSFLLGVPRIVVGFRDQGGVLRRLEEFRTQELPGKVKRLGRGSWDGNLCINCAAAVLGFLKATITTDGVYRIRRTENSPRLEVFKVAEGGHGEILTSEFLEARQQVLVKQVSRML